MTPAMMTPARTSTTGSEDTPSILVVEDDADLRETLAEVLRDEGFRVEVADEGRAAIDLLRHGFRADLILLDLVMPGMSGWEFRAFQRSESDASIAAIPVVVISAFGREFDATCLDAVAYLRKPLGLEALRVLWKVINDARRASGRPPAGRPGSA